MVSGADEMLPTEATREGEASNELKMLPTREEDFVYDIETSNLKPELKGDLIAYIKGDYGRLAYLIYPNLRGFSDPEVRGLVAGELSRDEKNKIGAAMIEVLAGLGDEVLAERIRTYVNVEKLQREALRDADVESSVSTGRIKKLEKSALKDGLTGLWNRRSFDESIGAVVDRVERAKEANQVRSAFLVMIDIDRFKQINDTYGHQAGDFVLRELAELLTKRGRKSEKPFRYGGEEFAIIADGLNYDEMVKMAERIRTAVEGHEFIYEGRRMDITISLGIAGLDDLGAGADAVLNDLARKSSVERFKRLADAALYFAKATGRNAVKRADDPEFLTYLRETVDKVDVVRSK